MRRIVTLFTLLALAVPLYVSEAEAVPTEICNPTPEVATSFCVTHDVTPSTTVAGKPVGVTYSVSNTSPGYPADKTTWIDTLVLDVLDAAGAPSSVTAGTTLPDNLRIAGGDVDCTSPTFTTCDAGFGTFATEITGNSGGAFVNGNRTGTFGIKQITNENPPTVGTAEFHVDAEFCVDLAIDICGITAQMLITIDSVGGLSQATFSGDETVPIPAGSGGGSADVTFSTLTLRFLGQSSTLADGSPAPAPGTFTITQLPATCSTVSGQGSFTSRTPARTVVVPKPVTVTNCTTTAVRAKAGRKIKVSGTVTEGDTPTTPFLPGTNVQVQLLAKKRGGFKVKATQQVPFNEVTGTFAAVFKSPNATKCKIVATFPGDADHGPSTGSKGVRC